MSLRLSGQNQLSYVGVTPLQPPDLVYIERDPISGSVANADYRQFNVGTFWLNPINQTLWVLVTKGGTPPAPVWLSLGIAPSGLITHFTTDDSNTVNPIALNVNIFGGSNINTTGATPTVTINLNPNIIVTSVTTNTLTVNNNATFSGNILTNLSRGVVQSPGGGGALFSDEGTDGQILISSSAGAPAWANIISSDASITVSNGANSIDITTVGSGGTLNTLTGNSGVATAAANNINVTTANSTPVFVGSGDDLVLDFLDIATSNLVLGSDLPSRTTGSSNTGVGAFSLLSITSGQFNTALGSVALNTVSSGNNNTALGDSAGTNIALGSNNIALGSSAGSSYTNENDNIVIGHIGTALDSGVIRIGTSGTHVSAFLQGISGSVSNEALVTVDTVTGELGVASGAGPLNQIDGNSGSATPTAGVINLITDNSTVLFVAAGDTITQDFGLTNLLLGSDGSLIAGATNNVGLGVDALAGLTSGMNNTGIGSTALNIVTVGSRNTAVGQSSLSFITTQNDNTAIGNNALSFCIGSNNTALGAGAAASILTGSNNIIIGKDAGSTLVGAEANNIYLGNVGVAAESATTRIGTNATQTRSFMAGVSGVAPVGPNQMVIINSSGQLGTQSIPAGGGAPSGFQVFTINGTFTTPATTTTDTVFEFTVIGEGGGGGGSVGSTSSVGGSGGAGGTSIYWVTALPALLACPVVIGSGAGTGGSAAGGNGGTGNTTTIDVNGTVVTANGGVGGEGQVGAGSGQDGAGGTSSNGTINITGQQGTISLIPDVIGFKHNGGSTTYGSGGIAIMPGTGNGGNGNGYGSGGASASGNGFTGGDGAQGIVIVKYW